MQVVWQQAYGLPSAALWKSRECTLPAACKQRVQICCMRMGTWGPHRGPTTAIPTCRQGMPPSPPVPPPTSTVLFLQVPQLLGQGARSPGSWGCWGRRPTSSPASVATHPSTRAPHRPGRRRAAICEGWRSGPGPARCRLHRALTNVLAVLPGDRCSSHHMAGLHRASNACLKPAGIGRLRDWCGAAVKTCGGLRVTPRCAAPVCVMEHCNICVAGDFCMSYVSCKPPF